MELDRTNTPFFSNKDPENCERCGGNNEFDGIDTSSSIQPSFDWVEGKWITGVMRPTKWIRRDYVSKFRWNNTLDFDSLHESITDGFKFVQNDKIVTEALCRYTTSSKLLDTLVCSCHKEGDRDPKW